MLTDILLAVLGLLLLGLVVWVILMALTFAVLYVLGMIVWFFGWYER